MSDDHQVDAHQELYSEVLALRKELVAVQEDEERLRNQLGNSKLHKAALKEEVGEELELLEEEATKSTLKGIWAKQLQDQSPDRMDWSTIDISNLHKRAKAARKLFLKAKKKADTLLAKQDKQVTKNADSNEATMAKLKDAFDEEMENLREARQRLRQVEMEESYHYKRGTGQKRPAAIAPSKVEKAKEENRIAEENRTIRRRAELEAENHDLKEDIKKLQTQIRESERMGQSNAAVLEAELRGVEEDGSEANEVLTKLKAEAARIAKLREDINRVLLYVHAEHRIQ